MNNFITIDPVQIGLILASFLGTLAAGLGGWVTRRTNIKLKEQEERSKQALEKQKQDADLQFLEQKQQIDDLRAEAEERRRQREIADRALDAQLALVPQLNTQLNALRDELATEREKSQKKAEDLAHSLGRLESMDNRLNEMGREMTAQQGTIRSLTQERDGLKERVDALERVTEIQGREAETMRNKLAEITELHTRTTQEYQQMKTDYRALEEKREAERLSAETELAELKARINELQQIANLAEEAANRYGEQIEQLKRERDAERLEKEAANRKIAQLEAERETLRQQVKDQSTQITKLQLQIRDLQLAATPPDATTAPETKPEPKE